MSTTLAPPQVDAPVAAVHAVDEMDAPSTLALRLGVRGAVTRVLEVEQQFPQRVTVPLYLDRGLPGEPAPTPDAPAMAYVCVQNPTAGLFWDDHLLTRVVLERGARAHLTQQAATQVFAAPASRPGGPARQAYDVELAEGSVLESFGRRATPHRDASLETTTDVRMGAGATYVGWEAFGVGRVGHGERHRYRSITASTRVRVEGTLVVSDVLHLQPGLLDPDGGGAMAGHDYHATLLVVAPWHDVGRLQEQVTDALDDLGPTHDVLAGVSTLPDGVGLTCRVLAHRAPALDHAAHALRTTLRRALLDLGTPARRW